MLTKRQHELLSFLVDYQARNAVSPSYEEIGKALNLTSKSAVHGLVSGLVKRGYCKRSANKARAIKILKKPETQSDVMVKAPPAVSEGDAFSIPFFGPITSTALVDVLQVNQKPIILSKSYFPERIQSADQLMAFEVQGDFLQTHAVLDKDIVVVEKTSELREGTCMLFSVNNQLLLRRWKHEGDKIEVIQANKYMTPVSFFAEDVKVHGHVVFLKRCCG